MHAIHDVLVVYAQAVALVVVVQWGRDVLLRQSCVLADLLQGVVLQDGAVLKDSDQQDRKSVV